MEKNVPKIDYVDVFLPFLDLLQRVLWEILQEILVGNLAGNFKICKSSSGSAAGNAVGNVVGKYSFLKTILNRFSHMTHQIEA